MRPWLLAVSLLVAACRGPSAQDQPAQAGEPQAEAAGRIEKLQAEEGDVLARRDELQRAREQVTVDRAALEEKRKQISAAGGDLRPVDDEERALRAREQRIVADERDLSRKIQSLLVGYQEVTAGAVGRDIGAREAQIAVREKDFARREKELAQREAGLAEREKELARRERETCSAPTIVQAPAAAAASRYTRKDIEPILTSARRKMADKGLLESDLPAPAVGLEREATAAMSSGDLGRARLAADQLQATVDSVAIDKGFIVAKINRLNAALKSAKLSPDARREADDLFRDATADYGDGKFAAANAKLNKIFAALR
jgi:hypothetical protein